MEKTDHQTHTMVIAARDDGDHDAAGARKYSFQVRARADNARPNWDYYEIGVAEYSVISTYRDTQMVRP